MDDGDVCDGVVGFEGDNFHSLGGSSHDADIANFGTYDEAFFGGDHEIVVFLDGFDGEEFAGFLGDFHGDDAFGAASGEAVVIEARAFAEAFFGEDENGFT